MLSSNLRRLIFLKNKHFMGRISEDLEVKLSGLVRSNTLTLNFLTLTLELPQWL